MSLFHLRLLKPHTHERIDRAVGDFIHTASADVAAWLVRLGIAVHAQPDTPDDAEEGNGRQSAPPAAGEPAAGSVDADLTTSTDTATTGDDHE